MSANIHSVSPKIRPALLLTVMDLKVMDVARLVRQDTPSQLIFSASFKINTVLSTILLDQLVSNAPKDIIWIVMVDANMLMLIANILTQPVSA